MESTEFNLVPLGHTAWDPLHSIRYHWATLHGTHSIPLGSIAPCCMEYTPFKTDTFAKIHGIHYIHSRCISHHCLKSSAFNRAALNPLHSIGIYCPTPHAIHCIHSGCISHCCMESSAFNHTVWNPLHSIGINYTKLNGISFIQWMYIAPPA